MKHLLTIAPLLMLISSSAQTVKISIENRSGYTQQTARWNHSEKTAYQDGDDIIQIEEIGFKKLQFYNAKYSDQKQSLIIHKADASGKEIALNQVESGARNFGPVPTQSIEFDNKILLFYFRYVDKDSMKLYYSELDKTNLQLINETYLFAYQQPNVGLFKLEKEFKRQIILRLSSDSSKLLMMAFGKKEEFLTCVFEKGMKLSRKKISMLQGTDGLSLSDAYIDNTGNCLSVFSEETATLISFLKTTLKKIFVQTAGNTEKLTDVSSLGTGGDLHNVQIQKSANQDKVFLFGDYAGTIFNAGIWLLELRSDNFNIVKPRLIPYPEDFLKKVHSLGFADRKRSEYGIYGTFYNLTEFQNGDLAICGSPTVTSSDGKYSADFAGPVIMAFLNGKKETVFSMIPRYQHFCSGSFSYFMPYQDKLLVIYNDYEKNINGTLLPDDVHQKAGPIVRELSLGYAVVKKDGTIETRKMLSEGVSRMNFYNTAACEKISDNKIIIPSTSMDKKTQDFKVAVITVE